MRLLETYLAVRVAALCQFPTLAVAINLKRISDWLNEQPRTKTRVSAFAALAPTPARRWNLPTVYMNCVHHPK
jgi:hypothetical protein